MDLNGGQITDNLNKSRSHYKSLAPPGGDSSFAKRTAKYTRSTRTIGFIQVNNYLENINAEKIDAKMASFFDETFGTPILRMYFEIDERNLIFSE